MNIVYQEGVIPVLDTGMTQVGAGMTTFIQFARYDVLIYIV
ncbi:hypothetical protein [Wolbachia endosymbiont (group A) of Rhinocyllus conicus]|nr:hypothetical protein [Wolbachia endosymbiont (group A) of Rhinocyllus conicus]